MADFPDEFLWGAATAAHQVEGGCLNNDWWAWEHAPGTPAAESSGDGIDHYHRYREDFALLAGLGHTAHRLSLEWSRIEPAPGEFSRATLDHYARVLTALGETGMTAFVTLHHFTLPRWLAEQGGWEAPDAPGRFGAYCERVAGALGDLMPYACTVNEPQIVALMGYRLGHFPPGVRDDGRFRAVTATLVAAHGAALEALRAGRGAPSAGLCLALFPIEPAELGADLFDAYLDGLDGDWVGVQYYAPMRAPEDGGLRSPPSGARLTQMGWEVAPEGLGWALRRAAQTGLPVFVTENGIATDDDAWRIEYIRRHLEQVVAARAEGVDVRGYLYWSAFDNFEWNEGYRPTFGLVGIDRARDLARVVRPSAEAYGRLIATGSLAALDG